ncbi:sugar ABC transporter substrate-binding protein [Candidatus Calescamantes bacterium]|nr:sugar ABC transporter substrate-binding protein [Candidatus Calescamantes bacterium]
MRIKWSIFIIILLLLLSGCTKATRKGENRITIQFSYEAAGSWMQMIEDTVRAFEKQYPNIEVKTDVVNHSILYRTKLLTRIASGAAPDVVYIDTNNFAAFYGKGVLLDLTPFIMKDDSFSLEDFYPSIVDYFTVDGKIFVIPRDVSAVSPVFYNKKLFDERGIPYPTSDWDWNKLVEVAKKLTVVENGKVKQYGFYANDWLNFIYSNGGKIVDNQKNPKKCLLDDPKVIQALKFYSDLMFRYRISPSLVDRNNLGMGIAELFMTGKVAMVNAGIWWVPEFRKIKDFEWDIVMFPRSPYTGLRKFNGGGSGYAIVKGTKHPKEAWQLVKYLSGKEGQKILTREGLIQPAIVSLANSEYFLKDPAPPSNKKVFIESIDDIIFPPQTPRWTEILYKIIFPEFEFVFLQQKTPEEVVKEITRKVNAILNEQ